MIAGSYVTNILAQGQRIAPPFTTTIVLRRSVAGMWQAATIAAPLSALQWPILSIRPEPGA